MKPQKKELDQNYTKILNAVLNKSWKQNPTKQQLYSHLPPISQIRQIRHVKHCWRSKDELINDILLWSPAHGHASVGDQQRLTSAVCGHKMQSKRLARNNGW